MKFIILLLSCLFSFSSFAEIEKIAIPNDNGMSFFWWPKLDAPKGWHKDKKHSFYYSSNAFAPDGFSFANAETVMYAKATYKPRQPDIKSLEQFIDNDKKTFLSHSPTIKINEVEPLTIADGKKLRSFIFTPQDKGNWERVSYHEEGDYYLVFTISSRSQQGYQSNKSSYIEMIKSYKE